MPSSRQRANAYRKKAENEKVRKSKLIHRLHHDLSPEARLEARNGGWIVKWIDPPRLNEETNRYFARVKYHRKPGIHTEPLRKVCEMDEDYHDYLIDVAYKNYAVYMDLIYEMGSWCVPLPIVSLCSPSPTLRFPFFHKAADFPFFTKGKSACFFPPLFFRKTKKNTFFCFPLFFHRLPKQGILSRFYTGQRILSPSPSD